jgi:hypothetical protein
LPNSNTGESANLHGGFNKNMFVSISFFWPAKLFRGILNRNPIFWLDGAKIYICKYIQITMAESYINDAQFGDKIIQRWKLPNSFVQVIIVVQRQSTEASLLNKSSHLAPALGVTKFIIDIDLILVTLCCAT